jgi:hypothetical protein
VNRSRLVWQNECLEALAVLQSKLKGKSLLGKKVDTQAFKTLKANLLEDMKFGIGFDHNSIESVIRNSPYFRLVKMLEGHPPLAKFMIGLIDYHTTKKYFNKNRKNSVKNFLEACKYKTLAELTEVLSDRHITVRFSDLPTLKDK